MRTWGTAKSICFWSPVFRCSDLGVPGQLWLRKEWIPIELDILRNIGIQDSSFGDTPCTFPL